MQSVGTRLREARIRKGYTLEDINARTRISLKNLNAIESDDLTKISSPFTYRSFVKQIADMLAVDFSALSPDVMAASSTMPEPLVPGQEEEVFLKPHQFQQAKPKRSFSWVYRTISIVVIAGAVSGYLIWRHSGIQAAKLPGNPLPSSSLVLNPPDETQTEPVRTDQGATQPLLTPVVAKFERSQQPDLDTQAARVQPEPDPAAIHIQLSAVERTWLSIVADGKTTYTGVLDPSQTKVLDGKASTRIRTANAGGLMIIFNGRSLGSLGHRGQSRTFVFTKSGYEVVRGAADRSIARGTPSGE
jgi:cytoskeletal protein RodZ